MCSGAASRAVMLVMTNTATAVLTSVVTWRREFFLRLRTLRTVYRSIRATWRTCGNSSRM